MYLYNYLREMGKFRARILDSLGIEAVLLLAAVAVDFVTFDIAILHRNYLFFKRF